MKITIIVLDIRFKPMHTETIFNIYLQINEPVAISLKADETSHEQSLISMSGVLVSTFE